MRPRDVAELFALPALWGGSFLFMRIAVPAFGPVALAALRVAPAAMPPTSTWLVVAALAFFCTGLTYILFFRLIANACPSNAIAVTYLVPILAIAWGGLVLGEALSWPLAAGCAVVFAGTALATGMTAPRIGRSRPEVAR